MKRSVFNKRKQARHFLLRVNDKNETSFWNVHSNHYQWAQRQLKSIYIKPSAIYIIIIKAKSFNHFSFLQFNSKFNMYIMKMIPFHQFLLRSGFTQNSVSSCYFESAGCKTATMVHWWFKNFDLNDEMSTRFKKYTPYLHFQI